MADSNVDITAGSGTSIDTRTESTNGNHRQVVVLGDPSTNAGVAPVDATNGLAVDVKQSALPSGAATAANQSTMITDLGGVTETAPATDTASSGLNGRLQRIAQRLTTLLDVFPTTIDTNSGNKSASTLRVVLATDQPQLTNKLLVTPDAGSTVTQIPSASSTGLSVSKTDALVATATSVKSSAGNVYGYHIYNSNTADIFVHFYNIASGSTTVGTSTRTVSVCVPGGGVLDGVFNTPIAFSTAITIAATTTITGSTAPSTGLLTNIFYI